MGPGSSLAALGARDDNGESSYSTCQTAMGNRPLSLCGRGGSPVFRSLFASPESRGMARRDGAPVNPGFVRLAPDLLRRTGRSMRPRLSARHARHLSAFAFVGARTMWDLPNRGSLPTPQLRGPLGGGITTPTRKYRIPAHQNDVS